MQGIPLRPDYSALRSRHTEPVFAAASALLLSFFRKQTLKEILHSMDADPATELVTRAATTPATTTTAQWGAELTGLRVADLAVLTSASAAGRLLASSRQYRFDGAGIILAPTITASADDASFIEQGAPIPVRQLSFVGGIPLTPKKLATISVFTREDTEQSIPNVIQTVTSVLSESLNLALDAAVLDATAADATRPAGLLNGVVAGTESASTVPSEAMLEDISNVVGSVASVAGNAPILIIASPKQYAALTTRVPNLRYEVLSSSALADKTVLAIASNAVTSAVDPTPRFEIARDSLLHFENTTPLEITTAAVGTTVKSTFQSDLIGLRAIFSCSWGLRSASGVALLEDVKW